MFLFLTGYVILCTNIYHVTLLCKLATIACWLVDYIPTRLLVISYVPPPPHTHTHTHTTQPAVTPMLFATLKIYATKIRSDGKCLVRRAQRIDYNPTCQLWALCKILL